MPVCFFNDCRWRFSSLKLLLSHYKYKHRLKSDGSEVSCNELDCSRSFSSFRALKDHFKRCHFDVDPSEDLPMPATLQSNTIRGEDFVGNVTVLMTSLEQTVCDTLHDNDLAEILSIDEFQAYIKWEAACMMQTLYNEDIVPRNKVQLVVDLVTNLFSTFIDFLQVNLPKVANDSEASISALLEPLRTPFLDLETEYKRFKYFASLGTFIPPETYLIAETTETITERGVQKTTTFKHEGQYIPLKKVLFHFLSSNSALTKILKYMEELKNEEHVLSNFTQGEHWCNKNYKKITIPLSIYSDSYETGANVSTHHGIYKLTAVYVAILPIPPEFKSVLCNIFLTMLFHSADHKAFGNTAVFQILIEELKLLYSEGIFFEMPEFSGKIYFTAELALGDNLDLNGKLGLVENFTANHPCRVCKIHISVLKTQTENSEVTLRNRENYETDVRKNSIKTTGIKENCIWHQLPYFHITENVGCDPLHDLLEGVCKYDFIVILKDLVYVKKFFTLEILNNAMKNYNYGVVDRNIPPLILDEELKKDKLRMSGSEMFTFCQFFGLYIGHYVPEGDQSWQLYISLRQILDIAFSSCLQKGVEDILNAHVWEHNQFYLNFHNTTEKFKFHILTHYPLLLKRFAVLKNLACLRFEGKHRPSIKTSKTVSTRRNICKTLAIKNQLKLHHYLQSKDVLKERLKLGPDSLLVERIGLYEQVRELLPKWNQSCRWVEAKGTLYKPEMCVITEFSDFLPQFAVIKEIFTFGTNNSVAFICQSVKTLNFHDHYFAFAVEMSDEIVVVPLDSLAIPFPTSISKDFRNDLFVTFIGN